MQKATQNGDANNACAQVKSNEKKVIGKVFFKDTEIRIKHFPIINATKVHVKERCR